jgi:hypothetical protein
MGKRKRASNNLALEEHPKGAFLFDVSGAVRSK